MTEAKYLEDNIRNMQRLMVTPPLRKSEAENLRKSLRLSRVIEYEHGEIITEEGEADPYIYFLLSGKIRMEKEGAEIGIVDAPGEIFGEINFLEGIVRSGTACSEGKTVCLGVYTHTSANRLTSDGEADVLVLLYRIFMEYIAIRLRLTNDELVRVKKEIERLTENRLSDS
jgi:CRP-like cAMP-binding protein